MILPPADWAALQLSLRLAMLTSITLLCLCTPLSLWLAHSRSYFAPLIHAVVALPLVLPPTVLGFYLLMVLGPRGVVGTLCAAVGFEPPAFSFSGLFLASLVVSTPFVVQPLHTAFSGLGRRPWEVAASLRASPLETFFTAILPMTRRAYLAAFVLAFAHTVGEFGVVLMIGGNIPGVTQTVSTAIFTHVEAIDYPAAHRLSLILIVLGFALVALVQYAERRGQQQTRSARDDS